MPRNGKANKGTILVQRSCKDRETAIKSAMISIERCGWTSLVLEEDYEDDFGTHHVGIRVRTNTEQKRAERALELVTE